MAFPSSMRTFGDLLRSSEDAAARGTKWAGDRWEMGAWMGRPGWAPSTKVPGEVFGGFRNIVMEQSLGGLGVFPPFFAVYTR